MKKVIDLNRRELETLSKSLARLTKTYETCSRIKGEYEELIAKLYEDPGTQVKISKAMCELDRRRQVTKIDTFEDTSGRRSDVKAEIGGRVP